jgi:hypothetical protein
VPRSPAEVRPRPTRRAGSAWPPRALVPSHPVGAVARGVLALDVSLLPPGVISVPTSRSERHRCCPYTSTASTRLVSVVLLLRAAERQRSRRGAPRVPRSLRSPRQQRTVVGAGAPAAVVVGRPGGGEPALGVVPLGRPWRSRTANPSRCLRRSSGSSLPATISSSPRAPLHTIPRTKELLMQCTGIGREGGKKNRVESKTAPPSCSRRWQRQKLANDGADAGMWKMFREQEKAWHGGEISRSRPPTESDASQQPTRKAWTRPALMIGRHCAAHNRTPFSSHLIQRRTGGYVRTHQRATPSPSSAHDRDSKLRAPNPGGHARPRHRSVSRRVSFLFESPSSSA